MPARILIYDSGAGTRVIHDAVLRHCPDSDIRVEADTVNFPYGDKTDDEIMSIVRAGFRHAVMSHLPDLAILGCNTASVHTLSLVRADHLGLQIIGTVPAIKPAVMQSTNGVIAVLATRATIRSQMIANMIRDHANGRIIHLIPAPGLANIAENKYNGQPYDTQAIADILAPLRVGGALQAVDTLVLGCTHYPIIADEIRAHVGRPITMIDSADGVARRAQNLLSSSKRNVKTQVL